MKDFGAKQEMEDRLVVEFQSSELKSLVSILSAMKKEESFRNGHLGTLIFIGFLVIVLFFIDFDFNGSEVSLFDLIGFALIKYINSGM